MPKISLEREIRKVLISTPIIEKEYYDPQKEKQLERKKSNKKNYGTIYFKKLTKKSLVTQINKFARNVYLMSLKS